MIKTLDNHTKVEFGKDNKASIAINAKKGTLMLRNLKSDQNIGDLQPDADEKGPAVEIEFYRPESVDAMIEALKTIKKNWVEPGLEICC